jgi:hypothetical protein
LVGLAISAGAHLHQFAELLRPVLRVELGIWIVKDLSGCELLNRAKWLSALDSCAVQQQTLILGSGQEHVVLFSCLSHSIADHPSPLPGNDF